MRHCLTGVGLSTTPLLRTVKSNTLRPFSTKILTPPFLSRSDHTPAIRRKIQPIWTICETKKKTSDLALQNDETIYALSTAPGRAAIAIIRISGPAALNIYQALCPDKQIPKPRYATLRSLYNPSSDHGDQQILDPSALVLYFPAPGTVTGEDILELHVHGGPAIVKAVLAAIPKSLIQTTNQQHLLIRYAEPGEFTRRAFYNNRLDLTQIEALGDTLSAETEQQRRLAIRGSSSTLAHRYEAWRERLLLARGELEALIDFSEDQHFDESPAELCSSVARQVRELITQLKGNIESAARGELLRNGINIALVGAPNAGKSSLLNCIVGREAAIVSPEAGTTRDVVDVSVDIGGYLCRFGDLAGLRKVDTGREEGDPTVGEVEQEGIRRATTRALIADVVIIIFAVDSSPSPAATASPTVKVPAPIATLLSRLSIPSQKVVCVLNKTDLLSNPLSSDTAAMKTSLLTTLLSHNPVLQHALISSSADSKPHIYPISCQTATTPQDPHPFPDSDPGNIQSLLKSLTALFASMTSPDSSQPNTSNNSDFTEALGATHRQRQLLSSCLTHLEDFLQLVSEPEPGHHKRDNEKAEDDGMGPVAGEVDGGVDIVLAAEHLRSAASCLARITGRGDGVGDVEAVLGVVFERFCVGK